MSKFTEEDAHKLIENLLIKYNNKPIIDYNYIEINLINSIKINKFSLSHYITYKSKFYEYINYVILNYIICKNKCDKLKNSNYADVRINYKQCKNCVDYDCKCNKHNKYNKFYQDYQDSKNIFMFYRNILKDELLNEFETYSFNNL